MKGLLDPRFNQPIMDLSRDPVASDRKGEMGPWGPLVVRGNQPARQGLNRFGCFGDVDKPVSLQAERKKDKDLSEEWEYFSEHG